MQSRTPTGIDAGDAGFGEIAVFCVIAVAFLAGLAGLGVLFRRLGWDVMRRRHHARSGLTRAERKILGRWYWRVMPRMAAVYVLYLVGFMLVLQWIGHVVRGGK
jgi:hypothetical protein